MAETYSPIFTQNANINFYQWKRISHKQSARWQHLSRLKASAFYSLQRKLFAKKCNSLYLGLVMPSSGR